MSFNEGPYVNRFILLFLTLLIASCGYSPWETEIDCRDYYQDNLQRLTQIEADTPGQLAFGVALLTDLHNQLSDTETAVERINQRDDIDFALILGDMTDQGLSVEYEWACKALSDLKVPRFYVIGNHDSISFGKEIFRENFAPFDYAFTYKEVKFILYNDNVYEFPDAPDYAFLENEAVVQPGEVRRQTVGVSHIPPNTSIHTEEEAATLRQFLFDHNFNLTLHGHHNEYYWLDEFGNPHYITSNVEGGKYGILFVAEDGQLSLQSCTATCTDATL
jgi:3',5'-cyclic AMP phosphodiesterase CpdA